MKFEIVCSDLDRAENLLNEFSEACEKQYRQEILKYKDKLKNIDFNNILNKLISEECVFLVYRENNKLYLRNSIKMPKLIIFLVKPIKKMENNIKLFLEANNIKVYSVKYVGD
jgi:hypothetical protein